MSDYCVCVCVCVRAYWCVSINGSPSRFGSYRSDGVIVVVVVDEETRLVFFGFDLLAVVSKTRNDKWLESYEKGKEQRIPSYSSLQSW
jgi:hypothetical protein